MENAKQLKIPSGLLARTTMLAVALAVASPTYAQQWQFEPIIRIGGEYDDNAALNVRTDEEVELTGLLADIKAVARYSSERTTFEFQPRVLMREYGDEGDESDDFNTEDFFLRSTLRFQGQSSAAGFRVFYDQQKVRTAERAISDLDVEDPDDLTDDDTGRVVFSGTRDKLRVAPYWSYSVSQTSSIGADLNYIDVAYDDIVAGVLNPYSDMRLNLKYRNDMTDRTSSLVTATGRQFSPDDDTSDINGYGIMAGFEYRLSETTRVTALVGLEDADGAESPEFVSSITMRQNLETISMFARYRRTLNASGAGALSIRDSLDFNFRRRLTEKISAGLGVRAYAQNGIGVASVDERNYIQLQSSMEWYISQAFVMEVSYRYSVLDRSAEVGERSNSNQVNLWFVYQPRTVPTL